MGNMSYCKFENTYKDLADCAESLYNEGTEELESSELRYALKVIELCKEIAENFNEIED